MVDSASYLDPGDAVAVAATEAIQSGDVAGLKRLLDEHPGLAATTV